MTRLVVSGKIISCLTAAALMMMLFVCCSSPQISHHKWKIVTDGAAETLRIEQVDLGTVLKDVKLVLRENDHIYYLSGWQIKPEDKKLIITTVNPKNTTWTFEPTATGLDASCSAENACLKAGAPADEKRIPARTENQDNGIMYTSLGLVSATNIRNLFDRATDIMIRFPEGSSLVRDPADNSNMQVTLPVIKGEEIALTNDYYIKELGLKYYKPQPERFKTAPIAWSSWYCYYMGTTEADVMQEADALSKYLMPYGLEYVQIDACYTRGEEANYLNWTKKTFPHGGKWLFQYVQDKGLKPALWVNIYGSNYAHAECADKYPENFYLRDKNGKLSGACCTADTTVVRLDYTNPEVIEKHLKPMFKILKNKWGVKYLKDAGWGTWMDYYEKNKINAFDSTRDSRDVYVEVQKALRETVGDDFYIGGCAMHEVGLCFGIFDGSRTGGDDQAVWYPEREGGMSMQVFFNSLFGANYLNNITWHCDPDAAMVRNPLTVEEGRTVVSTIALTGQLYMASDFMAKLPPKKIELYQKTMPTTPIVPIDLYPYKIKSNKRDGVVWCCPRVKEYPRAIDLKVNAVSGVYDVVAVYNWTDEDALKTISLGDDLGLDTRQAYLVFDFWNQKLKEHSKTDISTVIPPHGTSVYVVRPVLDHPHLIATSRHITCAVSIEQLEWDAAASMLKGTSRVVKGDPYSIFIHVPDAMSIANVNANAEIQYQKIEDSVLEVKFAGKPKTDTDDTIAWSVAF
ncbi:hypothetical protein JXJ21_14320 [candidate division KSB1 bacterium]|nr:hypothetical protein [candidate division KSB1 bacterium]